MTHGQLSRRTVSAVALVVVGACSSSSTGPTVPTTCGPLALGTKGHPTGVIDSVYPLSSRPFGVAVNSVGTIYIGRQDANDAVRGSIANFKFTTAVVVGLDPGTLAMSPNGATTAVANYNNNSVGFIDIASNSFGSTTPVGSNPTEVAYHPAGTKLYVGTVAAGLQILNATTYVAATPLAAGAVLNGMAFSPSACKLYVSSQSDGQVAEIQTSTDAILRFITVGASPEEVAISADSTELWVADEIAGVQLYSLPSGNFVTTVAGTAGAWGLAMTPDGQELYATLPTAGTIKVISRTGRAVTKTLTVNTPRRIAFDYTGAHAVVADEVLGAILIK